MTTGRGEINHVSDLIQWAQKVPNSCVSYLIHSGNCAFVIHSKSSYNISKFYMFTKARNHCLLYPNHSLVTMLHTKKHERVYFIYLQNGNPRFLSTAVRV